MKIGKSIGTRSGVLALFQFFKYFGKGKRPRVRGRSRRCHGRVSREIRRGRGFAKIFIFKQTSVDGALGLRVLFNKANGPSPISPIEPLNKRRIVSVVRLGFENFIFVHANIVYFLGKLGEFLNYQFKSFPVVFVIIPKELT